MFRQTTLASTAALSLKLGSLYQGTIVPFPPSFDKPYQEPFTMLFVGILLLGLANFFREKLRAARSE